MCTELFYLNLRYWARVGWLAVLWDLVIDFIFVFDLQPNFRSKQRSQENTKRRTEFVGLLMKMKILFTKNTLQV
jgi:hypothetical protein